MTDAVAKIPVEYLHTRSGKGKELCDLLRRELGVPDGVREFTVHFEMNEPVTVSCVYLPKATGK